MITIVWLWDKLAIRTVGDPDEMDHLFGEKSEWYPDKYPHPDPDVKELGQYMMVIQPEALRELDVRDLTPHEAFLAMSGLGLPEERDCGPTAVTQAFEHAVKSVKCRLIKGTHRSVLDSIVFEDGSELFLASAVEGAVVYRISKPRSYTKEALNESNA